MWGKRVAGWENERLSTVVNSQHEYPSNRERHGATRSGAQSSHSFTVNRCLGLVAAGTSPRIHVTRPHTCHTSPYIYEYICICQYIDIYQYIHTSLYVCLYVCMYVYTHTMGLVLKVLLNLYRDSSSSSLSRWDIGYRNCKGWQKRCRLPFRHSLGPPAPLPNFEGSDPFLQKSTRNRWYDLFPPDSCQKNLILR